VAASPRRVVSQISPALRVQVWTRAGGRCEYCLLPEAFLLAHEPDHVIATQHRGATSLENLALACFDCNRRKGPNISSIDPDTGEIVPLFSPRRDLWPVHFHLDACRIIGRTAIGRATAELLQFNNPARIQIREELRKAGQY
jgi:hypothetical protein